MILAVFLILEHLDLIGQRLIRRDKPKSAVIAAPVETVRPHDILDLMRIAHKIVRADLRAQHTDELALRLDPDRHESPGILHNSKRSLRRLRNILKEHSFSRKRQEDTLLLLDPHQEFFHGLIAQGPFSHIVIQVKNALVLVLQYLIELPGPKQSPGFREILDGKLTEIIRTLDLAVRSHNIRLLNDRRDGQLIFAPAAHDDEPALFHMSGTESLAVIGELYLRRVPVKSLVLKMHTKRRRVHQSPYLLSAFRPNCKTPPIYFPFSDNEY